jgi:hypothetical protein
MTPEPKFERWFRRWIYGIQVELVTVPIPDHMDAGGNIYTNCSIEMPESIAHLLAGPQEPWRLK